MNRYSKDRKIHEIVKLMLSKGWSFVWGAKHGKLFSPDGGVMITIPGSPSDHRSARNFERDLKRALRQLAEGTSRSFCSAEPVENVAIRSFANSCN